GVNSGERTRPQFDGPSKVNAALAVLAQALQPGRELCGRRKVRELRDVFQPAGIFELAGVAEPRIEGPHVERLARVAQCDERAVNGPVTMIVKILQRELRQVGHSFVW